MSAYCRYIVYHNAVIVYAAYKEAIILKWKAKFQLVPPDMHHRNKAERSIRNFKSHFLSILEGLLMRFPGFSGT